MGSNPDRQMSLGATDSSKIYARGLSITLMMEAVCTSETLVYFNETMRRYIPEDCRLQADFLPEVNFKIILLLPLTQRVTPLNDSNGPSHVRVYEYVWNGLKSYDIYTV
jgi:hypothetical protein